MTAVNRNAHGSLQSQTGVTVERCPWCLNNAQYLRYHDEEWGVPVHDDKNHFEFLVLEAAQAGLSWLTVLNKREHFRRAYDGFDPRIVSTYDDGKIRELMSNAGIIRNLRKIASSVSNARRYLEVQAEFGSFDRYIWRFVNDKTVINRWESLAEVPAKTNLSDEISSDLIRRGFSFVGSTIIYAHLQAVGLVNDHLVSCFRHSQLGQS